MYMYSTWIDNWKVSERGKQNEKIYDKTVSCIYYRLVLLGGAGFAQVSAQEVAPAPVDSSAISNIGRDYRITLINARRGYTPAVQRQIAKAEKNDEKAKPDFRKEKSTGPDGNNKRERDLSG